MLFFVFVVLVLVWGGLWWPELHCYFFPFVVWIICNKLLFSYLLFCGLCWPELHCYASPNSNYNWPLSDPAPAIQLFVCFFKNPINFAIDSKTLYFHNVDRIIIMSANEPQQRCCQDWGLWRRKLLLNKRIALNVNDRRRQHLQTNERRNVQKSCESEKL